VELDCRPWNQSLTDSVLAVELTGASSKQVEYEKLRSPALNELVPRGILIKDRSWEKNVFKYVSSHQKADGGYTFVQGNDANAQDTYYGTAILRSLDLPFPNFEKTVEWLHRFELSNIYAYYHIGKTLSLCGEDLDDRFRRYIASAITSRSKVASPEAYVDVDSEFQFTHKILELAHLLSIDLTGNETVDWLLRHKGADGGFGSRRHSDVSLTYYAVDSLKLLGFDVSSLKDTVAFLRTCEKPFGGFTIVPHSLAPYVEYTYFGVTSLDALGQQCQFLSQTVDFLLRCQNLNGGFARTDSGISTFENTFQAVSVMQRLTHP
jgi:hypothetical protein